jgi:hypothetical protein
MGLGKYASACEGLAEELRTSIDEKELADLHKLLAGRPILDWIKWRQANAKLVSAFVAATPSQRRNKKFRAHRLLLTMAGIQHCLEGHGLLAVVDESFLDPGCSYRSMAALAGEAYDRLYDFAIPDWPFDDLESPFVDEIGGQVT